MKIADIKIHDLAVKIEFFNNGIALEFLKRYPLKAVIDGFKSGADSINLTLNYNTEKEARDSYLNVTTRIKQFEGGDNV
jgi:hypothetical protein